MADGVFLTTAEYALFRQMAADYTRSRRTGRPRAELGGVDDRDFPAVETYVAFTPDDGIPALDAGDLAGTSNADLLDDVPGCADCRVFRVIGDCATDDATMYPVDPDHLLTVYNCSTTSIPGATWVVVTKDKSGYWWALAGGGGSVYVCGTPQNMIGTGTGTADTDECAQCVEDPHLTGPVELFKFDCDFEVEEYQHGHCSSDATGTGSEDTARTFGSTVRVRTRGKTVELTFGVNPIFCEGTTCTVLDQDLTLCFERGRFIGHRFGDAPVCGT